MTAQLYRLATSLILGGFVCMCQPFSQAVFTLGFPAILAGVALHIVLDHWPAGRVSVAADPTE